jgi:regulation of enolase protein 1 (concanavalin A-like superfamily)
MVVGLVASTTMAELIAFYPFSEGQGTTTVDATGNGNNGTFNGDVGWVAGYKGTAVRFDTAGERIVVGPVDPTAGTNAMTLAAWINWEGSGSSISNQGIIGKRLGWTTTGDTIKWFWQTNATGDLLFRADYSGGGQSMGWGNVALASHANEWTHVAVTWNDGDTLQYVNGEQVSSGTIALREAANATPVTIGCVDSTNTETFVGIIDEVRFYNAALTPEELEKAMTGEFYSSSALAPFPPDLSSDIRRDVVLSWSPGKYAATHNVYFGTDADVVAAADAANPMGVLVSGGQDANTYDPTGLLDYGQTYYWRVDEVNALPDGTVFPGSVWSFTAEPVLYTVQNIVVTASIPTALASGEPGVTIDLSGLTDGRHGTGDATMWSGDVVEGQTPWLQYDFDGVYKLFGMHIWNYNGLYEYVLGFGVKDFTIEYAVEPNEWLTLGDYALARGTSKNTYAGQLIDLDGVAARSIRININSTQNPAATQVGLSEIQFFHKPMMAREPKPASGTKEVKLTADLSWRPGREAASHQVHFSADEQAVIDGTALVDSVTESRFGPGSLNLGTSYFWRIDEVNEVATPDVWAGKVWNFTTTEYIGIDGFETYTDETDQEIYSYWLDGYDVTSNGSIVGHDFPPYAERKIVRSGSQAMPFYYNNTNGVVNSEAVRTLASAVDLSIGGADTLSLYYRGNPVAFEETSPGNILMSGAGADIYQLTDEFRYAYKQLTGDGSITARIDSIQNTNDWAKAGVMIRATLETGTMQAHMVAAPTDRVEWMPRLTAGTNATGTATDVGSTPLPYWVRVTRQGSTFTGQYSADGQTWTTVAGTTPATIAMPNTVYIGLVVCSHAAGTACGVEFSSVSTTGNVTAQWELAAVGVEQPAGNEADTFYITVEDSSGKKKTVNHPSLAAVGAGAWTQWRIPLSDLTAGGVNVKSVKKFYIGVGDKTKPSQNASGLIYIDDLAFGHPAD